MKKAFLCLSQQLHSYTRNKIGVSAGWHQLKCKTIVIYSIVTVITGDGIYY